ncbi:MAG TPA: HAD hydrolase-like protein [Gemmatimonadaceae bacterium]|nr:HAD hydrolase-like protein [Gemmatimonadaceae bacterium]
MTRTGILFEIDGTLFDTDAMRADALHAALAAEGVAVSRDDVARAHAGVTALMTIDALPAAAGLDDTSRELVLLRSVRAIETELDVRMPSFDVSARDAMLDAAAEFPLGVVTRATRGQAHRMLELAALESCVTVVRSLAELPIERHAVAWTEAAARLLAERVAAIAPAAMLRGARDAGLRTIVLADANGAGEHRSDATLASLARLQPSHVLMAFTPLPDLTSLP